MLYILIVIVAVQSLAIIWLARWCLALFKCYEKLSDRVTAIESIFKAIGFVHDRAKEANETLGQ